MRIMHVTGHLGLGGAEKTAVLIANEQLERCTATKIFYCAVRSIQMDLQAQLNKNITVLELKRKGTFDFSAFLRFRVFVTSNRVDVVHVHNTPVYFVFASLLLLPVKIIWHDNFGRTNTRLVNRNRWLHSYLLKRLHAYIGVNHELINWALKTQSGVRAYYIPNFSQNFKSNAVSVQEAFPKKFAIAHLAHFRRQKDHRTLIEAFALLKNSISQAKLLLIGQSFDEEYHREIKNLVAAKSLESEVVFVGAVDNPGCYLRLCSVGVLSSESEGLPLALIEYGLSFLVPVVTDVGQCSEVLANGTIGYVVPPKRPELLAHAMKEALTKADVSQTVAKTFNDYVRKNYSSDRVMKEIFTVYTS